MSCEKQTVIERARAYANRAAPAVSGQGGHAAAMKVARTLVSGFCLSPDEAMGLMREFNARCLPPWSDADLAHKVRSAERTASPHPQGWMLGTQPVLCAALRDNLQVPARHLQWDENSLKKLAGGLEITPRWLADRSPVEPKSVDAGQFLTHAFEADQKALIFTKQQSQGQALWPDEPPPSAGPEGVWFLIQPVDGRYHENPRSGKPSRRSEESVTQWRHMLLESDEAPNGLWLAAICRLPLPVVSIASSGNRSMHVLIRLMAETKQEWNEARDQMLAPLTELGCDPAAMTAVRLARLPGCLRVDKSTKQALFYLNPAPEPVPLAAS